MIHPTKRLLTEYNSQHNKADHHRQQPSQVLLHYNCSRLFEHRFVFIKYPVSNKKRAGK